ncbi:MAG: hypothetical protein WBU92_03210, partial [Candidatus Dormiibacterota bacterium]
MSYLKKAFAGNIANRAQRPDRSRRRHQAAPVHPLFAGRGLAMGIALSLAAAVGYGASDFLAGVAGRRG